MGAIIRMLKSLVQLIISLVKFIPVILKDFIIVIELVLNTLTSLPTLFIVFPSVLSAILMSVFGVVIIYKVLGREG